MIDKKKIISFFMMASMFMVCMAISVFAEGYMYVDESFEDGVLPDYFTTQIAGTGTVTVETDAKSGQKAVKVVSEAKNESFNGFSVPFEDVKNGILTIEFKLRCEKRTALFNDLTVSGEGGRIIDYVDLKGTLYYYKGKWQSNTITTLSSEYKKFKYVIDIDNKKVDIYVNDKIIKSQMDFYSDSVTSVRTLNFKNQYSDKRYGAGGAWLPAEEGDAIFWVDDIKVWQNGLTIEGSEPEENTEIGVGDSIKVAFNENVDYSFVQDYIEVYKGEEKVSKEKYVASVDGKELTMFFIEGFDYNTAYSLKILKGMRAEENSYLPLKDDFVLNFKTKRLFDEIDGIENDKSYSTFSAVLPLKDGVEITAQLEMPDGSIEEYISGTEISEIGKFTLTITGVDEETGKSQVDVYNFEVVGEQPPIAKDILIEVKPDGKLNKESSLFISWSYYDVNGDEEGEHEYQWYISDKKDTGFEAIEGANGRVYTLSENDLNKYLKVSVIPVSVKEEGEEYFSDVFTGFFLPEASDVIIEGEPGLGKEIVVSYKYKDENDISGESESGTEIFWYKSTDNGKNWVKIEGAEGLKYTMSESDADCLIRAGVTPAKAGAKGEEIYSESLAGMMKPEAQYLKIVGTPKVGQSIYVSYTFIDENKDKEGNSKIEWYMDDELISTGKSLQLTSKMKSKKIYAKVIPVSENYPYEGAGVESERISVSANVTKGGGGGGGSAISITSPNPEKEEKPEAKPEIKDEPKEEKAKFFDIENHWAKETIIEMYENGVVKGISENAFAPDVPITRAQFATMILNLIGIDEIAENIEFSDVGDEDWFEDAVLKVASKGYMNGFDGKFRPNDYITREEICVVIKNVVNAELEETVREEFADEENISDWAKDAVTFTVISGIVNGKGSNMFAPKDNATRAEGLVMLKRMTDKLEVAK